jgi:predicted regulator of Ras-like GTPase activity (Roadblock/LC7/MglB family)
MADERRIVESLMEIPGAAAAALIDGVNGECLAARGDGTLDVEKAARLYAEAFRIRGGATEEVVMTLGRQTHIVRRLPCGAEPVGALLLLVTDRVSTNLALCRLQVTEAAAELASVTAPSAAPDHWDADEEELPPFMRTDAVLRLLGITTPEGVAAPPAAAPAPEGAYAHGTR